MTKHIWVVFFFMTLSVFSPKTFAAEQAAKDNWMYVINAQAVDVLPDQNVEGQYKLKLQNISPQVLVFSERPNKEVDAMPAQGFFNGWKAKDKKFKKNPANAALDPLDDGEGETEDPIYLLNLQNPVYNEALKTLEFDAISVTDESRKPERLSHRKVGSKLSGSLRETAVFIDHLPENL